MGDNLIDNFDEMLIEVETLDMARRLKYALSAQFVDRLEDGGKINTTEKLRLKDILEDANGNPKAGDNTEAMKRELKRLKIEDHREEPFAPFANRETETYYTRNDENRSRYDDWRMQIISEGFRRSESNPKFFRTASKNNWKRDSSKFGRRSSSRPYRDRSRFRSRSRNGFSPKTREKSAERPKSDLLKKVETMEKEIGVIKSSPKSKVP